MLCTVHPLFHMVEPPQLSNEKPSSTNAQSPLCRLLFLTHESRLSFLICCSRTRQVQCCDVLKRSFGFAARGTCAESGTRVANGDRARSQRTRQTFKQEPRTAENSSLVEEVTQQLYSVIARDRANGTLEPRGRNLLISHYLTSVISP